MQITEYPHKTPKPWRAVAHTQVPQLPSTLSNCSSRTSSSSGITEKFWECRSTLSSTSSKRSSSSLKQTRTYWAIFQGTIHDSALQQEEYFSQKNSCHETSIIKAEKEIIDVKDVTTLQDESECEHSDNLEQYLEDDQTFHWHTEQKEPKFAFRKQNTESPSVLSHRCKDCKIIFQMSTDQVHWFLQRSLHVPKRCEECRRKRNCSKKAKKLIAKWMQITQYPHKTPKPWRAVAHTQVPKLPSTLSNCSSRTSSSSGITEKFWECCSTLSSTSSKRSSSSLKQTRTYWAIS